MPPLTHAEILRSGRYRDLSLDGVDPNLVRRLHDFMVKLRIYEEVLMEEYHPANEMRCPIHFCVGQEAAPAALRQVLEPDDCLFTHHRSHGYFLAKDAPLNALVAELYGKATGANGGKSGSQDISMPSHRVFGGAILAGAVAIAVGAAFALERQKRRSVSVTGFGEAATEEGIFWESVNFASVRNLPIVFVCENNLYSMWSPQLKRQPADDLSRRVAAFGMHTETLFGNDVINVHRVIEEAVERARNGGGPTFVESYTYRWVGHVGPENDDHLEYRSQEEIDSWKRNCPIELLEEKMLEEGLVDERDIAELRGEAHREIAAAIQFGKDSPFPAEADWSELNLCSETPLADELLAAESAADFDHHQLYAVPGPY